LQSAEPVDVNALSHGVCVLLLLLSHGQCFNIRYIEATPQYLQIYSQKQRFRVQSFRS
jgi:hypothetical protein